MKQIGKVYKVDDKIEGENSNGQPWVKQTLVIETADGSRERKLAFDFLGEDRVKMLESLNKGDLVDVSFEIQCNEHEGKFYTSLKGYGLDVFKKEA